MFQRVVALIGLCIAWPASAIEFDLGPVSGVLNTRLTLGAQMRVQNRDERLIAKLAVPGQQDICAPDDCVSATGNPEPNQRLVNARGAFSGVNEDNGNLNYDRGDFSAVLIQLRPRLDLFWGEWQFQGSALFFHDLVNAGFQERHADTRFQAERSPRNDEIESLFASGVRVGNLLVTRSFQIGNEELLIKIGNQTLNWGEANLVQFNSLAEINPLDAPVFGFPGAEISQIQLHMPLAVASLSLGVGLTAELHYHLQWRAAKLPASGSLLSFNDVAGGGRYAMLGLGNFNEDPDQQFQPAGLTSQISQAQRTLFIPSQRFGAARDSGQFGLRLNYLADWLNNGTELTFHALNYHSRVPVLSAFAAQASCTRDAESPGFLAALVACEGFNGPMNPQGREPLPVDSIRPFLDYVEDIRLFGLSFNTNVGDWALSGEIAHRPNHPLQVLQTDVLFAALGPAFPAEDIPVGLRSLADSANLNSVPAPLRATVTALQNGLGSLPAGAVFTLPGENNAVPDQLSAYRGITVEPGQLVRGFERLQTSQLTLTAARVIGPNPLGASQILFAAEAAVLQVHNMPGRERLTLEGAGDRTHPSPGADGTGSDNGQPDTRRINPTQMTSGFGDALSYGYRVLARLTYSDLPGRMTLNPTVVFLHDLEGISPAPVINFIEGRRIILTSLQADFLSDWSAGLTYQVFTGGGTRHRLRDRDNVSAFLAYTF